MKYLIPECNMEKLNHKLEIIRKKCARYGCNFRYEVTSETYKSHTFDDGTTGMVKYLEVDVEGVAKVDSWEMLAIIEHSYQSGNIVRLFDESRPIPQEYYTRPSFCDHCNTSRYRKYTAILFNSTTHQFKQVGSSCLKLFTRGFDAKFVANMLQFFATYEDHQSFEGGLGSYHRYHDLDLYLKYVAECTTKFGFFTTSCEYSTKSRAHEAMNYFEYGKLPYGVKSSDSFLPAYESVKFDPDSESNLELVSAVKQWVSSNIDDDSLFMHNLKVIFQAGYILYKDFGLVAASVNAYNKYMHKQQVESQRSLIAAKSEFVGNIHEKVTIQIKSAKVSGMYETQFGSNSVYTFIDINDNVYVWFTSVYVDLDRIDSLTGTIKDHKEYRGEKQTVLTRCRVKYKPEVEIVDESTRDVDQALDMFFKLTEM